jgi:RNA polymerase sigma-70 factor, ECF subfamily
VCKVAPFAPDTDLLLDRASQGDGAARQQLLSRHRQRLRKMIALRLDRRLAARVDPSDVVQDALAEADRKLAHYLRDRPLPFYPWLRQIAAERLAKLHRRHLRAGKRDVRCEEPGIFNLPDESALAIAARLMAPQSSPSTNLLRQELRQRVQNALARLGERDRDVLVLRYLEQLSTRQTAEVLGITDGAVKTRHLRALERLRTLLGENLGEL